MHTDNDRYCKIPITSPLKRKTHIALREEGPSLSSLHSLRWILTPLILQGCQPFTCLQQAFRNRSSGGPFCCGLNKIIRNYIIGKFGQKSISWLFTAILSRKCLDHMEIITGKSKNFKLTPE